MLTPATYARHLATYIASPTKIEALTRVEFGRAPPLHEIVRMRSRVEHDAAKLKSPRRHWCKGNPDLDGEDFMPGSLVPREKPRERDYITIEPSPPLAIIPTPANPFGGLYNTGGRLIASVAFDFNLTVEDIIGPVRNTQLVDARAVCAKLLRLRGKSFHQIARILGGRDHSTICHAIRMFEIYRRRNDTAALSYERHLKLIESADAA